LYGRSKSMAFDTCSIKNNHSVAAVPKKSKKRQAKTQLLQIRSTPIALAASLPDLLIQV